MFEFEARLSLSYIETCCTLPHLLPPTPSKMDNNGGDLCEADVWAGGNLTSSSS